MRLNRQTKQSMKRVAVGALLFVAAAAFVRFGYVAGLTIGADKALIAMLICIALAAALELLFLAAGGK